jgi:hypothetical protein
MVTVDGSMGEGSGFSALCSRGRLSPSSFPQEREFTAPGSHHPAWMPAFAGMRSRGLDSPAKPLQRPGRQLCSTRM